MLMLGKPLERITICIAMACLARVASAQINKITVTARALFQGLDGSSLAQPLRIEITNSGESTRGLLTIRNGNQDVNIPIELPRGTPKALTAYPVGQSYMGIEVHLDTLVGRKTAQVQNNFAWSDSGHTPGAVMISSTPGALAFFRTSSESRGSGGTGRPTVRDGYCVPELAPDRAIGYSDVDLVVLGEGSERLSDQAVRALQRWVLVGGTLIIPGGASTPLLADKRWSTVLPMKSAATRSVNDLPELRSALSISKPTGPVAITTGDLNGPGESQSDASGIWKATRPIGLGKIIQWSFNPFETPLDKAKYAELLVKGEIEGNETRRNIAWLVGDEATNAGQTPIEPSSEPSPFETKIPPAERIFGTLLVYFIIVIPINFWILRRVGRAELAWFTTPLLSIGFAAVFFTYAGNLYGSGQAVAYHGVLVASETQPESMFVGGAQLFFPKGGTYDLRMSAVEAVYPKNAQFRAFGAPTDLVRKEPLTLVDVGEVRGSIEATNLTFQEFEFWQQQPAVKLGLTTKWADRTKSALKGEIANRSAYPLAKVVLVYRGRAYPVCETLKPGETKPFSVKPSDGGELPLIGILGTSAPAIHADLEGFKPGPQVGEESKATRKVQLAYSFDMTSVTGP